MQRPIMDPMAVAHDDASAGPGAAAMAAAIAGERLRRVWRASKWVGRLLFSQRLRFRKGDPDATTPLVVRLAKGIAYRTLFVPMFVALAAAALVYRGTHPLHFATDGLPQVPGMFYETVQFGAPDGQPLMAWFVPVVDARRVLELKEKVYKGRQPAVVLVHDYNQTPSQMVPLIEPLHARGLVVMVVGLRGAGHGGAVGPQTFGLNESADVRAAIAELRARATVDADRLAVVGVGSGANAALVAASQELGVRALVLVDASETPDDAIRRWVGPRRQALRWMRQPAKWAFEVGYHLDAEDLHVARFRHVTDTRPTLTLQWGGMVDFNDDPTMVSTIAGFCREHLPDPGNDLIPPTPLAAGR